MSKFFAILIAVQTSATKQVSPSSPAGLNGRHAILTPPIGKEISDKNVRAWNSIFFAKNKCAELRNIKEKSKSFWIYHNNSHDFDFFNYTVLKQLHRHHRGRPEVL